MTEGRKPGQGRGFAGDILRLVGAAVLLGTVVFVTLHEVNSTGDQVSQRRVQDRVGLATALAAPLNASLEGAKGAAAAVAGGTAQVAGWDALRVDRTGAFTGLSGRYVALSGVARAHPCPVGAGLRDLVDAAGRSATPVVMVLAPPGSCQESVIGAAASVPGGFVVVTGAVDAFMAQAAVASHFESGIQTYVVDPAGTTLATNKAGTSAVAMPTHLGPFVAQVSGAQPAAARHTNAAGTEVVDAGAAIGGGWAVVVEQDAASLDAPATELPKGTLLIAGILFVAVLLLQLTADARRRATARHASAHNAAFLAVLAHELRTPLTVIRGFVDTLSSRWDNLADEQRHDLVDRLPQQTRRMNRVVDKLLLAANLQTGSLPRPALDAVEVVPALERVANDYAPLAPLHEFVVEAEPDLVMRTDPKMLQQILDQLVDNAVKYSPTGGKVRLSAVRRRGDIEIAIEDEGVGLPRDTRSIFEAFAQGEAVDSRVHAEGGVGLGLFIVRALCQQLGASVRAERREPGSSNAGSRLVVTLRGVRSRVLQRG